MAVLNGMRRMIHWGPVVVASVAAALMVAVTPVVASAAGSLPFLGSFGSEGGGAGQLSNARGVAVDQSEGASKGDVYVADLVNQRIDKFGPVGNFLLAFGRKVDATKVKLAEEGGSVSEVEENICTAESGDVCQSGEAGGANGEFFYPLGVAVDPSSGSVYIEDWINHRVDKYSPSGQFLLAFGGEVNAGTLGNICTAAETCQSGSTASESEAGEGKFHFWGIGALIGVAPFGTVYVGDENRVQEFDSAGAYQGQIALPGAGNVTSLAVDGSGHVYVAAPGFAGVGEYDSTGTSIRTFDEGSTSIAGVAADPSDNVWILDFAEGYRVLRYDSTGTLLEASAAGPIKSSTGIGVSGSNTAYVSDWERNKVLLFGSAPSGGPPPAIDAEFASHVGAREALVEANINPEFLSTNYYVEYGTDTSYGLGDEPPTPGVSLGVANLGDDRAQVPLAGLQPGTTYHYRFVAVSAAGTTYGKDSTFTTYTPTPLALPDGRAFELVSPADKNSGEVAIPRPSGGGSDLSVEPLQASPDGERITYTSFTAFGSSQSAPAASQYLSARNLGGWQTEDLSPPDHEGYLRDPLRGFSEDLSIGVLEQSEPPLAEGAPAGYENIYLRSNLSRGIEALTTVTPQVAEGQHYCASYAGSSLDFKHVIFTANGALTGDAPKAAGNSLYEWDEGQLRLVSVLPNGSAAQPSTANGFGGVGFGCEVANRISYRAISQDGSKIFWTYYREGPTELLVRKDGTRTVQVDAPHGVAGEGGYGTYWAASADGSKVFFTDRVPLTVDATPGSEYNLYEYDVNTETLTDLTPVSSGQIAGVEGVLGAAADGSYVYFVAEGSLALGAVNKRFARNLYVWHAGEGIRYIASLAEAGSGGEVSSDASDWSESPKQQTARVADDGRHVVFLSHKSLTGYDNVDVATDVPDAEVYEYSTEDAKLTCASCNPSGARPLGSSMLAPWRTPYVQPRYLSDDGSVVFFESTDALAVHDTNGKRDVYEFERAGAGSCDSSSVGYVPAAEGCIFAISTGASADDSYFLDASANGHDIFISTRESLGAQDTDEHFDVYDARVNGGFPAIEPPASCSGEACRPSQPVVTFGMPGSVTATGAGNLTATPTHHSKRHKNHWHRHKHKSHRHKGRSKKGRRS